MSAFFVRDAPTKVVAHKEYNTRVVISRKSRCNFVTFSQYASCQVVNFVTFLQYASCQDVRVLSVGSHHVAPLNGRAESGLASVVVAASLPLSVVV